MLNLLYQGHYALVTLIVIALIISLTFHEFGHAITAKWFGDDTAERMGRLTLNPVAHIDPVGLLMVVLVGFGFAKPVPTNPNNYRNYWADFMVSAAGPLMNLLLAILVVNIYQLGIQMQWEFFYQEGVRYFCTYLAIINLILMIFNLIPLGPLDGHYIFPYLLPKDLAHKYRIFNAKYGALALLSLVALSIMGVPVFSFVMKVGYAILPYITFV